MRRSLSITFVLGVIIGGLVGLLFWYWQKSTSAEDGALELLDRLALTDRRLREATATSWPQPERTMPTETKMSDEVPSFLSRPSSADDLTRVKGIGPVFAKRLVSAGIDSLNRLQATTAVELSALLDIPESRAAQILAAAAETNL